MIAIRPLSALLQDIKLGLTGDAVSFDQLLLDFHERGFGFFIFLFALPAAIPLPGLGINTIIALPLLTLTVQMMIGRHTIWLPQAVRSQTISRQKLTGFIDGAIPWIQKIEIFTKPRLGFITQGPASLILGFVCFVMAVAVAIPLPLTNTVPSMGLALVGIGMMMRDGLVILGGTLIGLAWIALLVFSIVFVTLYGIDIIQNIRNVI